jgi:hypothetical protein
LTAIGVIDSERSERTPLPATAARDIEPGGLALSGIMHLCVLILVIVGLPSLFRHPPPQDTPIAVNLVTIAPETRATHPNPFRPRANAKPEPPIAAPAPKPVPKPEPPKPVPPPPPEKPKPEKEVRQAHHAPPAVKEDPAAFNRLLKTLEEKHPERTHAKLVKNVEQKRPEANFDALLKNLTREQTADAEDTPPAPHHTVAAAAPSSQPRAPLGSQLTASDIDLVREKLRPCFNPPFGAKEKPDLAAEIRVVMNRDGTVQQARVVDMGQYSSDQVYRALADAGMRALRNPECSPLPLPADRYDVWQTIVFPFSIKDMQ